MEIISNKGWEEVRLEDLFLHVTGGDWGKALEEQIDEDYVEVLCIRGGEIKNWTKDKGNTASLRVIKNSSLQSRKLQKGDILLEISGGGPEQPVGRTVIIDDEVLQFKPEIPKVCTNFLRLVRLIDLIDKQFINHYLQYFYESGEVVNYQGGSNNLRNLKFKDYSGIPIPLPPLAEQQRIVAKVDSLFARIKKLKSSMERIPQLLKDFRQKVLTQAVTGKLTEEWREGQELDEWNRNSLENIADVVDPHPSHRTPPEVSNGIPYVSIKDVSNDKQVTLETARKISWQVLEEHKNRYTLRIGDFVFGKIGTIGRPIILPDFKVSPYTLSANIILIQPNKEIVEPYFIYLYLDSPVLMEEVMSKSSATSQSAFGIKKMRDLIVPIPPIEEQQEIVRRVESLFAKADKLEEQYQTLKEKLEQLPQALLAKAFRGELVEQLPTDGDARELLDEIKLATEGLEKGGKSKRLKAEEEKRMVAEDGARYGKG